MFWRNLKLCAAVPSNWRKPRPKFDLTYAKFEFEFPEDLDTLKDKGGTRWSWVIEKLPTLTFCRKNSYTHICLCHAVHVSTLTLTSTITPQGRTLIHEKWFKLLLHISQTYLRWQSPSDQYPYGIWEQNSKTSLWAYFQIAVKTRWQNSVQWFSVLLYHDSWKNARKSFCIRIGHVIRRSSIKCCLSKWRHRIKRQS